MGACTGTTLRSASSWDRDARWANLFWNKLCSLGSGSGLPPITSGFSTVSPTTQWSHLRILLWRPPHLPTAPGNHLPPPPLLPGFLIQSALYVVLATSLLRLPLPTVLAGHLLYSAITFLHPLCALALLLPCLHRLHVRGQPLADSANWGVRF